MILLSKLWNKINFTCLYKKAIIKFYIEFEECIMFFLVQAPLMKYQKKIIFRIVVHFVTYWLIKMVFFGISVWAESMISVH